MGRYLAPLGRITVLGGMKRCEGIWIASGTACAKSDFCDIVKKLMVRKFGKWLECIGLKIRFLNYLWIA